jgi:hypothetical protein
VLAHVNVLIRPGGVEMIELFRSMHVDVTIQSGGSF